MKNKTTIFIGRLLVFTARCFTPYVSKVCRCIWYQPNEPAGFEDFARKK